MKSRAFAQIGVVGFLFLQCVSTSEGGVIVEYTFADEVLNTTKNSGSTINNTGSLGATMDGTMLGMGTIIASPDSPDGKAIQLSGSPGNGIDMPNAFTYGNALTVEALVRLDSYSGQTIIFDDFGSPGVILDVSGTGTLRFQVTTDGTVGTASVTAADLFPISSGNTTSDWHHVAGTYNGSQIKLFMDGQLLGSASLTGAVTKILPSENSAFSPSLGVESANVEFPWHGGIDDFRIHDVAIDFSRDVVPEPTSVAVWSILGLAVVVRTRRKHRCGGVPGETSGA